MPFQSSPGQRTGRYKDVPDIFYLGNKFQSSPGQRTGRYRQDLRARARDIMGFNPRPVKEPGATGRKESIQKYGGMFQSSPGQRTGRYRTMLLERAIWRKSFNPRPVKEPGATLLPQALDDSWGDVSILARSKNRALPGAWRHHRPARRQFQSSPGQRTGRYQVNGALYLSVFRSFNPRPVKEPGATPRNVPRPQHGRGVSILARSKNRALQEFRKEYVALLKVSILARSKNRALLKEKGS